MFTNTSWQIMRRACKT